MHSRARVILSFSKIFLVLASFVFSFEVFSMSMYVFDVGAGNFTLFKYRDRAFIVDCGTYRNHISSYANSKEFKGIVKDVLSGTNQLKIAVTHAHIDHYGLIKHLFFSNESVYPQSKIAGILVCARNPIVALQGLPVTLVTNVYTPHNEEVVRNFLEDVLFEQPDANNFVETLMVNDDFEPTGDENSQDYFHDVNMIFKVNYGSEKKKQAVLLPGDASARLISITKVQHSDLYKNVKCILWPHHGSCGTGQEALIAFAPQDVVSIISSFPQPTWYLPRENIRPFLNALSPLPKSVFSNGHRIWFCKGKDRISMTNSSYIFMTSANRIDGSPIGVDYIRCDFEDGKLSLSYKSDDVPHYGVKRLKKQ